MLHWLPICPNYRCEYYPPTSSTMMINYQRWQLMYLARSHNLTLIVYHLSFLFVSLSYLSLFSLCHLCSFISDKQPSLRKESSVYILSIVRVLLWFSFFLSVYFSFSLISLYASLFVQNAHLLRGIDLFNFHSARGREKHGDK